jgi:hypothetical protein
MSLYLLEIVWTIVFQLNDDDDEDDDPSLLTLIVSY